MPITKERFSEGLSELIAQCMEAGMHTSEMIGPLKAALAEARINSMPSKSDDAHNAKRGMAPMTEAQIRQALELEPYEPIPAQRL